MDLVNTISNRRDPKIGIDRMDSTEKIASWCVHQNLLSKREARSLVRLCPASGHETVLVGSVAELRRAAGEIFDAVASGRTPPSEAVAQVLLTSGDVRVSLINIPGDYREACRLSIGQISIEAVVALMAILVVDGLFRLPRERVRSCPGCGWLFCDRSKGGRRKWCSMEACGNREKVRRHYRSKQR